MEHNHDCYCGTGYGTPHETGTNGCIRFMTDVPDLSEGVTEYVYKKQRGYHQHSCGCWTTHGDSANSLDA